MTDPKEVCYEDKGDEHGVAGGCKRFSDVWKEMRLDLVWDGKICNVNFLHGR